MNTLLNLFPFHAMSRCVGFLAHIPLPKPLSTFTVSTFARAYNIDIEASRQPLESFSCVGNFFTRDLKPELRPMSSGLVSPVDGTLRAMQRITDGTLVQVKGVSFSISDLLHSRDDAKLFDGGVAWNIYLSPRDAHHIHMPAAGSVRLSRHIPGALFPVNDWALKNVPGLFVRNERVVSLLETEVGSLAVVMVGAANVGSISLAYSDIEAWKGRTISSVAHEPKAAVEKGAKLGTFHLGSSVVLLGTRDLATRAKQIPEFTKVQYGQTFEI